MSKEMATPKMEQEGWVVFHRTQCKSGFIDRWMGDCINNPNNKNESQLQLNAFSTYFRLNGKGKWIHHREFNKSVYEMLLDKDSLTAEEIWNNCTNPQPNE